MINWKLRLQNKTTLTSLVLMCIELVYIILNTVGVIPKIEQQEIITIAEVVIGILALLGIVVDPTTEGVGDSQRALSYTSPGVSDLLDYEYCDDSKTENPE